MTTTSIASSRLVPVEAPRATPAELLAAREERVRRRQELQRSHPGTAVVTVSLVVPGPVKSSPRLEAVRDEAVEAAVRLAGSRGWTVLARVVVDGRTGPEGALAVDAPAAALKRALAELEDRHRLGRLWDLDVHDGTRGLGRADLGLAPRPCLVCGEVAHACARSQAHPLPELLAALGVLGERCRA